MPYSIFPQIDENNKFPPVVRQAMALYQELIDAFAAKIHKHNASDIDAGVLDNARLPGRLGVDTGNSNVTDWNAVIFSGWYQGNNALNAPTSGVWYLGDVVVHNALWVTQTIHAFTGDSPTNTQVWRRSSSDVGGVRTWEAWYKLQLSQSEQDARYQALIAAGTTAQYYRGDKTWQTLNAMAVGLGNVNDTSDASKPVSTAQAAADELLAKGLVLSQSVATNSGAFSGLTVVHNIPTFTFKAGRKYRIVWDADWYPTANDTAMAFIITQASTADAAGVTTGMTTLNARNSQGRLANISNSAITQAYVEPTVDTTLQIKFCAQIDGAGTSLVIQGNRTGAAVRYRIYDDGKQTVS